MKFDGYTIALLIRRQDAPKLSEAEEAEIQDAHMANLADLHESGQLLVAGPVPGPPDSDLRGFSILKVDLERAREIKESDPAVLAGLYRIEVHPWILPSGLIAFSHGRLPRSMSEASGL
jgi:uncharacterized protein YciI